MKFNVVDLTPVPTAWSEWEKFFAWLPVTVEIRNKEKATYWLCWMERRSKRVRGIIWPENVYRWWEYRPINVSKGGES